MVRHFKHYFWQENACARVVIKLQTSAYKFIKKESAMQVCSYEFWENFKNTFLYNSFGDCFSIFAKVSANVQIAWNLVE